MKFFSFVFCFFFLSGAIGLLLISSAVTISVPFAMGKVIDTIYKSSDDSVKMMTDLSLLCKVLILVFICGAAANFGRIFLMETSGKWRRDYLNLFAHLFKSFCQLQTCTD